MSRALVAEAGREVLSAAERLMDGMLVEEQRCFERIAVGLGGVATELETGLRNVVREVGLQGVPPSVPELLPAAARVFQAVLPPIGDLLATGRERTLVVVRRQLRAVESQAGDRWRGMSGRATKETAARAAEQESVWYDRAMAKLGVAVLEARRLMSDQALTWWSRKEPLEGLVARWCSPDLVSLPGSMSRGALWTVRSSMTMEARNSAVALTNGLLLQGMTSWNAAVTPLAEAR